VKDYDAEVTFYQQLANHDSVLRAASPGSEVRSWTISGKTASGSPFSLALRNRYVSDYDIADAVPWDVADQVYILSSLKGVTLDSVDISGTVTEDTTTYRVGRVQQYRAGAWHWISRTRPVYGHAGQTLNLRTALSSETGTRFVSSKVKIPNSVRGVKGSYTIGGVAEETDDDEFFDDEEYEEYPSGSLSEILAYYRKQRSTDQLYGSLRAGGRTVSFKTNPADKIIYGSVTVPVRVALR
jgi:hypothetical protein